MAGRGYARHVTTTSELAAVVALVRTGARPGHIYADMIEEAGEARSVLQAEQGLLADQLAASAADDIAAWRQDGFGLLTVLDPAYPDNLRGVYDRPPLLFVSGRLEADDARSVAVIGSRRATADGLASARAIAAHLNAGGFTVTSGLAAGIDTAAHTAALDAGGRTVAVLGTGLRRVYPRQNERLQQRIAADCAVVSQFWPDDPPTRRSFPMRNAVMSGMSLATVVVEAFDRSGARTQARLALAHGRPVLLLSDLLEQEWAGALAERPGVHTVDSPEEIVALVDRLSSTAAPAS